MDFINEASWDRLTRIVLGLVMIVLGWSGLFDGLIAVALRIFGFVPLITGLIGWDPVYAVIGLDTRKRRNSRK